jgi:hypothetical protein
MIQKKELEEGIPNDRDIENRSRFRTRHHRVFGKTGTRE